MAVEIVKKVLDAFEMGEPESVGRLGGTATLKYAVRVRRGRFVVRARPAEFADEAMIRFDHESLWRLAERGLPVPCPQRRSDSTSWVRTDEGVFEVLSWVEGDPFPEDDLEAVANVGQFLARFHLALSDHIPAGKEGILREDHPDLLEPYVTQLRALCSNLDQKNEVQRIAEQLDMVRRALDGDLYPRLPKVIIHGDIHPGNIQFKGSNVSAVYDFDYLSLQARCRDVVDALIFFAAHRDQPLDPDNIYLLTQPFALDFERSSVLLGGYQRVSRLLNVEWQALPWIIRSQWLQIRLRGSRKVTKEKKLPFVLDRFFEMVDWLDEESEEFFKRLAILSTG